MIRRACVSSVVVLVVLVILTAPALAYAPVLPVPVDAGARLVPGTGGATFIWSESDGAALKAARVPLGAGTALGPYTVVSGIASPGAWFASGDGPSVTVLWKDGDTVYVKRHDLSTDADGYPRRAVCTDGQATALYGSSTTVVPAGISADGDGGAYIWCTVSPGPAGGSYTLLNHIDATGALATTTPAMKPVGRKVIALDSDDAGHACLLLTGGSDATVDRLGPALSSDWSGARSPYLLPPRPTPSMTAIALVATDDIFLIWRESGKVKAQRFDSSGDRLWLVPPSVSMGGAVKLTTDGSGGVYIVGPSGDGIAARHILGTGREATWGPSISSRLGLTTPRVDAVTGNRAGDLFAAYDDEAAAPTGAAGVAVLPYTGGAWSDVSPAPAAGQYTGAAPDGAGGAWMLGTGADAALWHISQAERSLTLRPRALLVQYGKSVVLAGYDTAMGGVPVGESVAVGTVKGGTFTRVATTISNGTGYYQKTVRPKRNAYWMTSAGSDSGPVLIRVSPAVTMALSHKISGRRLTEIFSGSVKPAHRGARINIQRKVSGSWRTVAKGRLDSRSRYRVSWRLPYRTATYKLRTLVKADSSFADGASTTATLKVKIRKG